MSTEMSHPYKYVNVYNVLYSIISLYVSSEYALVIYFLMGNIFNFLYTHNFYWATNTMNFTLLCWIFFMPPPLPQLWSRLELSTRSSLFQCAFGWLVPEKYHLLEWGNTQALPLFSPYATSRKSLELEGQSHCSHCLVLMLHSYSWAPRLANSPKPDTDALYLRLGILRLRDKNKEKSKSKPNSVFNNKPTHKSIQDPH